jgi:hypothetical protein
MRDFVRTGDDKMFSQIVQTWLLRVLVVLAAIGLILLYTELRNARKKEAMWLRSTPPRKPNRSIASDYRSRSRR